MYKHTHRHRVTYGQTDRMGYLYYGNYPSIYEVGRVEAIRHLGFTYKSLEDELKVMMPVLEVQARYRKPAYYDELLTVHTILDELPTKMIIFRCEIYNEADEKIHEATIKLFFIDMNTGARVSAPELLTQKIRPYFES